MGNAKITTLIEFWDKEPTTFHLRCSVLLPLPLRRSQYLHESTWWPQDPKILNPWLEAASRALCWRSARACQHQRGLGLASPPLSGRRHRRLVSKGLFKACPSCSNSALPQGLHHTPRTGWGTYLNSSSSNHRHHNKGAAASCPAFPILSETMNATHRTPELRAFKCQDNS